MATLEALKAEKKAQKSFSVPASVLSGGPVPKAVLDKLRAHAAEKGWLAGEKPPWDPKDTPAGVYDISSLRGAARELFHTRDFLTVIAGPAETGKSWASLKYVNALLWKYPGAQWVMARKTYSSCIATCLNTYKRIIGDNPQIKAYGGEKPEWFDYANGSRLWVAGMDNMQKVLSAERDGFYFNQIEEMTLDEVETATSRATGRGAVMPYTRVFGCANPGPPDHWIRTNPRVKLLHSRHEDNPTLFEYAPDGTEQGDEWPDVAYDGRVGRWTEQGLRSIEILSGMTGMRRKRLYEGLWVQAEGAVYEEFDADVHTIPAFKIPREWRRIRVIDFGYTNPFVCLWIAIDPDGRMYVYREIYITGMLVSEVARDIRNLSTDEKYEATICDHDAEDRATLAAEGIKSVPAWKSIKPGIDAVANRLKVQRDGRPRLMILRGSIDVKMTPPKKMPDVALTEKKHPYCTAQEFGYYVWAEDRTGRPNKEEPVDEFNHGMDCLRYGVGYVDQLGKRKIRAA